MEKKKFEIVCDVEKAKGWQCWTVHAFDKNDALRRFNSGDGEFEEEEIEVISLGDPEVTEIEDKEF